MEARDSQKVVHSPTIPPHYVTMSMMQLSYDLNHHTVQVANCAHLFVSTFTNVLTNEYAQIETWTVWWSVLFWLHSYTYC